MTADGKVYNEITKKYLKIDEHRYRLTTAEGKIKAIQLKDLYKAVYGKVFCTDNIENEEGEIWKEIAETEGRYFVSNKGRVKSYCSYEAKIMKQTTTYKGYKKVMIVLDGKSFNKYVHCLVASAFAEDCGKPQDNTWQVHHKNNRPEDNNSSNLQWVSEIEHYKIHYKEKEKQEND